MIVQTIETAEHIVCHYEKDGKMVKNRFLKGDYKVENAEEELAKQWNKTYGTTKNAAPKTAAKTTEAKSDSK